MSISEKNYWLDTVQMPEGNVSELPVSADVVVLGAGFTGLSAALELACRGVNVLVLEAETIGWGASSRNGGMVLTGMKLGVGELKKRYGLEATRRMYRASIESIELVEKIVREEKIDCAFSRCGHLEVACKQAHLEKFRRSAELIAKEFGHELRVIPRNELGAEIGSEIYYGGMVDETSAGLNPAQYVAGLARAALRAGAQIKEHTRVQRIESGGRNGNAGFRCITGSRTVKAKEILVATSGYTSATTPALHRKIIPIGSYIIATERLSDSLAKELSPKNRMIFDSKNYLYYYRLTPDNRMLFGGRAAFFPEGGDKVRRSAEILRQGMIEVFPQLRGAKVEYAWGGTLDFAFDIMPHAGKMDGMYYAVGYAGHGVAMATYLGRKMAQAICTGQDENPYCDIPFPGAPLGLYNGRPWFLPFAGAWYKLLDWVS